MYDDSPVGSCRDKPLETAPSPRDTVGPNTTPAVPRPSRPRTTRRPTGRPTSPGSACSVIYSVVRGRRLAGSISPAPEVDGPLVDDLITLNDVHPLVQGNRRVDVRRQHA